MRLRGVLVDEWSGGGGRGREEVKVEKELRVTTALSVWMDGI